MRFLQALGLAVVACSSLASSTKTLKPRNYETHDYYTLHLRSGESPIKVARALGLDFEGSVGEIENHFYFSAKRGTHQAEEALEDVRQKLRKRELVPENLSGILWSRKQRLKPRMHKRGPLPPAPAGARAPPVIPGDDKSKDGTSTAAIAQRQQVALKLNIADPIFAEQWHLFNTKELGHDVNVSTVWMDGNTGKGATVAVVDDGIDMYSDDLKDNYFKEGSYDFNDHSDEPKPKLDDDKHGTRCAGEIAAVKNNICGVGVAYDSKVAGIRILGGTISDEDEAVAINYEMQKNNIYSCSWGPPDDGQSMDAPDTLIKRAILTGVQKGRGGLGSIFVFAAGNGAASDDNCNFDGYTNSIYSITVGAIDRKGGHPYYSEKCSASLVVTYSSGAGDAIHTTDVGTNKCYDGHGGTSAAAPLGAGIFALVLSERPDLNWRDLQYLCVETAVPINLEDGEWQDTYMGKKYSHTYAYGKLDAYAIVEKAKTWKSVKPQSWYDSPWQHVKHPIPQGDKGLASSFEITEKMLKDANFERLEQVTVTMNVEHQQRGDLSVELISPHGIKSHLSATRRNDHLAAGYDDWTFMSVVHWGEPGHGKWTVIVKDTVQNDMTGNFTDWRIKLWGESINPRSAKPHPMPTDQDDEDHDKVLASVSTTSISVGPSSDLPTKPTDHQDRPVNNKPPPTTTYSWDISGHPENTDWFANKPADEPDHPYVPDPFPIEEEPYHGNEVAGAPHEHPDAPKDMPTTTWDISGHPENTDWFKNHPADEPEHPYIADPFPPDDEEEKHGGGIAMAPAEHPHLPHDSPTTTWDISGHPENTDWFANKPADEPDHPYVPDPFPIEEEPYHENEVAGAPHEHPDAPKDMPTTTWDISGHPENTDWFKNHPADEPKHPYIPDPFPPDDEDADKEEQYHLPKIFPTFGVSPKTQIWIYGAVAAILVFCVALGGFFLMQRRKNSGPKYESLEMDESTPGMRQKRAGELYDAFAGESEEEGLVSDSEDESEHGQYGEKGYKDEGSKERL